MFEDHPLVPVTKINGCISQYQSPPQVFMVAKKLTCVGRPWFFNTHRTVDQNQVFHKEKIPLQDGLLSFCNKKERQTRGKGRLFVCKARTGTLGANIHKIKNAALCKK